MPREPSSVPFLPQDSRMTSIGVIKVPDGLPVQLGLVGFFYPTAQELDTGALTSVYPDLVYPLLTFNVFSGVVFGVCCNILHRRDKLVARQRAAVATAGAA